MHARSPTAQCTVNCHYCVTCTHIEKKAACYSCQGFAALFSRPVLCSVYMHLFACDSGQSNSYLFQLLLVNTYTLHITLNPDFHYIRHMMMLYLSSELTKQPLGTTSGPNVFITTSFRFRITSVLYCESPQLPS